MRASPWLGVPAAGSRRTIAGLSLLVVILAGTTILPYQRVVATSSAAIPVRVATATTGDFQATTVLSGEFKPTEQVDIAPRISARVMRLPVTVGAVVRTGDVIAELDRTALDIAQAQAQAALARERAALARTESGSRPEDLVKEEANVAAAEARLAQVLEGPRPQDVDVAVQKLNQAVSTRDRLASQLSNAKEQARIALDQSMASLQAAQAQYGASKLVYDEAARTGKDPNISPPRAGQPDNRDLTDIKLRAYKADFEAKEASLRAAEAAVEARRLAYEDAKRQEIAGLQIAATDILTSQANLDKARSGPDPDVIAKAQADVEAARAARARAQQPFTEADLGAQRAAIQAAEAGVRLAEYNLREAVVVAPFDGIITQRYVSTGSNVGPSTPIVQLVSTTIEARLSADDAQVTTVHPDQDATLSVGAIPGLRLPAHVTGISPTVNATSRLFTVTLALSAVDERLRPGMLVQAEIASEARPQALTIPETALLPRGADTFVFVVIDDKLQSRRITPGLRGAGLVEVLEGLAEGDVVVVQGQASLKDGDLVTVTQ